MRVTSSANGTPLASHSLGYMLISVKPGDGVDLVQVQPAAAAVEEEVDPRQTAARLP